jgi:hypothetical protein
MHNRRRIADPDASKPEDWDEDAPRQVEDDEAEKPEGWLDDEPAEVDDPGARCPFLPLLCHFPAWQLPRSLVASCSVSEARNV